MKRKIERSIMFGSSVSATLLLLCICVLYIFDRIEYVDFYAINGDFQNYNGVRRLLHGQIPFRDFVFYLGLGPLYATTVVTAFFGGSFADSLIASHLLTFTAFSVSIAVVAAAYRVKKERIPFIVLLFVAIATGYLHFSTLLSPITTLEFFDYIAPGNSYRMMRVVFPFLLAGAALLFWDTLTQSPRIQHIHASPWKRAVLWGGAAGAAILWSSDYGIAVALSITLLYILLFLFQKNDRIWTAPLQLFTLAASATTSMIAFASLLTFGHAAEWFRYTFLGVAAEQFHYFGLQPTEKVLQLQDIPIHFSAILSITFALSYAIRIRKHRQTRHDIILFFLHTSVTTAAYLYALNSKAEGLFLPVSLLIAVAVVSALFRVTPTFLSLRVRSIIALLFVVLVTILVYERGITTWKSYQMREGVYIKALEGRLSHGGGELIEVQQTVMQEGEEIFSTYASAFEVMNNSFQPSGTDYIIHVLGNETRERYMDAFTKNPAPYASTIRADMIDIEYWVTYANWYFYRELLRRYIPISQTAYSVLWRRDDAASQAIEDAFANMTCEIRQLGAHQVELAVRAELKQGVAGATALPPEATADLLVAYSSGWKHGERAFWDLRTILFAKNAVTEHSLPSSGKQHMGIPLLRNKEGLYIGKTILTVYPETSAQVWVSECQGEAVLPALPVKISNLDQN